MGLNDLQLNDAMLAGLFPRSLVAASHPLKEQSSPQAGLIPENMEEPAIAEITSTPIAEPTPVFQKPEKPAILGHNLKHVTIIVQYQQDVHLPDAQLQFLSALLTACKLTVADVAIHNFQNRNEFKAADITSFLKSKTVLLFGVSPTAFGLPIDFPAFQIQPLAGITYLYSPNLEYFQTADDAEMKLRKSQLWLCLKQIFLI